MYQEANNKTIVLLSAGHFAACAARDDHMWSLPAVGRELSCSEGVCRFVSLIFHVLRMKTGWESGAVAALFVLHSVTISEKKVWLFM